MLMSTINTLLRDREFDNLDDICNYYDVSRADVESKLSSDGFVYSESENKIR